MTLLLLLLFIIVSVLNVLLVMQVKRTQNQVQEAIALAARWESIAAKFERNYNVAMGKP